MNDTAQPDEATWKRRLDDGAKQMGVELDESQVEALWRYAHMLRERNEHVNLTSIVSPEGILTLHMLDSLSVAPHLGDAQRIIDVGTGGGFPGVPLAVACPQREFTLIDGTQKKIRFVAESVAALDIRNVHAVAARAESFQGKKNFDAVIVRAVGALADVLHNAGALLAPQGRLLAMKGRAPDDEIKDLPRGWHAEVIRLRVPGLDAERHLVVISRQRRGGKTRVRSATMKRIIAVANQKGGVGKTTTAVNLAASFAATRRRVLLIDIDPQGNATMGCGVEKSQIQRGTGDVLLGEAEAASVILPLESTPGLSLMPSNQDLTAAEVRLLTTMAGRELRLRNALRPIYQQYEVILIDCPPALNMLTLNALVAAQSVLIPMQCEYYALEGLSALVGTIEQIKGAVNPNLEIEGILRTMFDPRNNLANEVSSQLIAHFGDKVFRTIVPRNVRLAEAPSFGKPVLQHDKDSRGALAYLALAGEMLRKDDEAANEPEVAPPPDEPAAEAEHPTN